MIQDIKPHQLDNQYHPEREPEPDDYVLSYQSQKILCNTTGGELRLPRVKDLSKKENLIYLFSIDEKAFFLMPETAGAVMVENPYASDSSESGNSLVSGHVKEDEPVVLYGDMAECPDTSDVGYSYQNVWRNRRGIKAEQELMFAVATGKHLSHWYRTNRFCGCCGHATENDKKERALICPSCGNRIYPRLVPAVIIAVTNGDTILVTKYGDRDLPFYALVAGFVEIGETLEECVEREVMEEVGLHVKNIRYYKSQPWGIVDDVLMGFWCEVDGDPTIHLDHQELKEGIWAKRGEVPLQPDHFSLTGEMMRVFNEGRL